MGKDCPCNGCEKRTVTCHYQGACKPWDEWKNAHEAKLDSIRAEKKKADCHSKAYEKMINRSLRRR